MFAVAYHKQGLFLGLTLSLPLSSAGGFFIQPVTSKVLELPEVPRSYFNELLLEVTKKQISFIVDEFWSSKLGSFDAHLSNFGSMKRSFIICFYLRCIADIGLGLD